MVSRIAPSAELRLILTWVLLYSFRDFYDCSQFDR